MPQGQRSIQVEPSGRLSSLTATLTHPSTSLLLGLGVALSYVLFGVLAYFYYPTPYSPAHNNTLSQLGNIRRNPDGYLFYLIGCAVSGTLAMAFFASLGHWKQTGTELQNRLLLVVQALGMAGGFGLFMNAVFPENHLRIHDFWAGIVFTGLGLALLLSPYVFRRPRGLNLGVTGIGALTFAMVILMFIFGRDHWMEWIPVGLFLIAPGLLGAHARASSP